MSFLTDLQNEFPVLPKQERKVALFILQDPELVQTSSITQLANAAKVSSATITRLTKHLKCTSFTDLKIKLATASSSNNLETEEKSKNTTHQVYDFYNRVLSETLAKLNFKQLRKVTDLIKSSRRIYFYGVVSSGYTSLEVTQRLLRMGIPAFAETESQNMLMTSSIISDQDLIIAISSTGSTTAVINALKVAKENKAKVVALTGYNSSPIAKLADIIISVQDTNYINDARFINSQFSMIYVIDIITTILLEDKKYHERMAKTINTVINTKFASFNKKQNISIKGIYTVVLIELFCHLFQSSFLHHE